MCLFLVVRLLGLVFGFALLKAGVQYNAYYYENGNDLVNDPNVSHDPKQGMNMSLGLGSCMWRWSKK